VQRECHAARPLRLLGFRGWNSGKASIYTWSGEVFAMDDEKNVGIATLNTPTALFALQQSVNFTR
jgi:hypothetical protein